MYTTKSLDKTPLHLIASFTPEKMISLGHEDLALSHVQNGHDSGSAASSTCSFR
jgi:hypothetical protein